jgi:hypothetical protein
LPSFPGPHCPPYKPNRKTRKRKKEEKGGRHSSNGWNEEGYQKINTTGK